MPVTKGINREILEEDDAPEEIEHDLIKDSVLQIANTDFKINDDFDELPAGEIRRNALEELSQEYRGKPMSRKMFSQRNWIRDNFDKGNKNEEERHFSDGIGSNDECDEMVNLSLKSDEDAESNMSDYDQSGSQESRESDQELPSDRSEFEASESESKKERSSDHVAIDIFSSQVKNINEDIKKGNSIKNQLLLWENLIECRIKLQKGLAASNRLLQTESFADFKSRLAPDEASSVSSTYRTLIDLLETFIQLKECILRKCPEYSSFIKIGNLVDAKKNPVKDDDEEITSESDDENDVKEVSDNETEEIESPPAKKRKVLEDYSEYLADLSDKYKPFRDSVIQKWNDKTRLASGKIGISKFAILEQSTLKQIEQILLDRDRLVKRTQTRRSKLPVLGKEKNKEQQSDNEHPKEDSDVPEHPKTEEEALDCEIFDDDDFYHKLLKDFIDRKTSEVTDPAQLGRQWTKLQKLRSKMKKKVDTRATKGRKIRYSVHNKLVSFMAPVPYSTWDDKVEQDLFRSLFGQASLNINTPLD